MQWWSEVQLVFWVVLSVFLNYKHYTKAIHYENPGSVTNQYGLEWDHVFFYGSYDL